MIHLDPFLIVFATLFGMGLAHLVLGTWSIWPAVGVHIFFNLFSDLPATTADVSGGWYATLSFYVIPLAAAVAGMALLWHWLRGDATFRAEQPRRGILASWSEPT